MVTLIIFLVILAVLVLVHEFGHFIIAKAFGIRVDEFGLGFPPRIVGWRPKWNRRKADGSIEARQSETLYSLNWIPFGGFVKIFGEDGDTPENSTEDAGIQKLSSHDSGNSRNFANKNRGIQVAVLVAGIIFNLIFAWLLISGGYMVGLPSSVSDDLSVRYPSALTDINLTITSITPKSPADNAGLRVGDTLSSVSALIATITKNKIVANNQSTDMSFDILQGVNLNPDSLEKFVATHANQPISFVDNRGALTQTISVTPVSGIVVGRPAIGIGMDMIGRLKLDPMQALYEGARLTKDLVQATTVGIGTFIWQAVTGHANLSQVTGPVGIEGLVGDARQLGFIYLLSFTALISINLAVINLVPFPALDGGRILFVAIEAVTRRRINPKVTNIINTVGFFLLIALLLVITFREVIARFF
jgi:regulator of sigma E protease